MPAGGDGEVPEGRDGPRGGSPPTPLGPAHGDGELGSAIAAAALPAVAGLDDERARFYVQRGSPTDGEDWVAGGRGATGKPRC